MKQVNQYSVYIRRNRDEQPVAIYFESNDMAGAQVELNKWLVKERETHPNTYPTSKMRRAYKTSNAGTYHPNCVSVKISNI